VPKLQLRREQALEKYRLQSVTPDESNALRVCREFTGDVLIVESEHDTVIPRQVIVNYREACIHAKSLTYRLMEGADHGLTNEAWHGAYTALLVSWFNEFVFSKKMTEATGAEKKASITAPETTFTEANLGRKRDRLRGPASDYAVLIRYVPGSGLTRLSVRGARGSLSSWLRPMPCDPTRNAPARPWRDQCLRAAGFRRSPKLGIVVAR